MRPASAALVAALVVLAGCNGMAGGSSDRTVTPAPVPTTEPTETPGARLAPGLHAGGVENATALGRAHDRSLAATSFTRRTTLTVRFANGTRYARAVRVTRVGADRTDFRHTTRVSGAWARHRGHGSGDVVRQTVRSEGGRVVQSHTLDNGTSLSHDVPSEEGALLRRTFTRPGGDRVTALLTGIDTSVAGRTTLNGTDVYRVIAVGVPPDRLPSTDVTGPGEGHLRATVDGAGLVREYTIVYRGEIDDRPVTIEWVTRYMAIGATSVDVHGPSRDGEGNRTGSG